MKNKTMKFVYVFTILVCLTICNYAQDVSHDEDLHIVLNNKTLNDTSLKYGIEPYYNNSNELEITETKNSGTFISFNIIILNNDYIKKLKINKKNEVDKNGRNNAIINIGFYGIYPNERDFSSNKPILIDESINSNNITVSQLISQIAVSGKLLNKVNVEDLYLMCLNVKDKNNVLAKNFLDEELKGKLQPGFVYMLWDKMYYTKEPEFLKESSYSLRLVSEIISDSKKQNNSAINIKKSFQGISKNNLVIRKNIENYFDSKNIILKDNNYEIDFPNTGDVLLLKNLHSEPKQDDPCKINLNYKNINLKFVQPNKENNKLVDPKSISLINEAKNHIVIDINGRNNINDKTRIIYDKLHNSIRYPEIFGEISDIEIGFTAYKNAEIFGPQNIIGDDTIEIPIEIINEPFLNNGFYDTIGSKTDTLEVKFNIVFKESKKYNQTIKIPDKIKYKINKDKLPALFQMPDSLSDIWEISCGEKKKMLKEEDVEFLKEIPIKRKTYNKEYVLKLSGQFPEKFRYQIKGFNPNQSRRSVNYTFNKTNDFLLIILNSPEKILTEDSIFLILEKPFGYNVSFENEDIFNNWKNDKLFIDLLNADTVNLVFTSITPVNILYIDLSNAKRKDKIIEIIEKKTIKCEEDNCLTCVFISNQSSPIITAYDDDHMMALNAISGLNPTPPNLENDIEILINYIYIKRSTIEFNFIFSETTYALSGEDIIKTTLIDLYNLYGKKLSSIDEILGKINKKINNNVIINIYGDNISTNNSYESENYRIFELTKMQ